MKIRENMQLVSKNEDVRGLVDVRSNERRKASDAYSSCALFKKVVLNFLKIMSL